MQVSWSAIAASLPVFRSHVPKPPLLKDTAKLRVIVADDSKVYLAQLRRVLGSGSYDLRVFSDGLEAWECLKSEDVPTIAILDWMMPGMDGIDLCRKVRSLKRIHYAYVLLLTSKDHIENILEGFQAGADDYICKPFEPAVLNARLYVAERIIGFQKSLIMAREQLAESEERYRCFVENTTALICTHDLEGKVLSINPAAARALGYSQRRCVGKNIRNILAPEAQAGFDLYLEQIRQQKEASGHMTLMTRSKQRLMWSYTNRLIDGKEPYVLGHAQDVTDQVVMKRALRKSQEDALALEKKLSRTDALTGLANRRAFYETTESERKRAERYSRPLSLAYIDLDNFKQVNDSQGHETGDQVLACVGEVLRSNLRADSQAARLGGDEFAVLLPEIPHSGAMVAVERLHRLLTAAMEKRKWPVSFSIGMVTFTTTPETTDEIVSAADQLMYKVKREGKNRVSALEIDAARPPHYATTKVV